MVTAAVLALAAACTSTTSTDAGPGNQSVVSANGGSTAPSGTTAPAEQPSYDPGPISWRECTPTGFQCARVDVPLNYEKMDGPKLTLGVKRKQAGDAKNKIGTLFLNPGGPGASGLVALPNIISDFDPEILAKFDVVSWDPRGVGESAPLTCDRGALDFYSTDLSETKVSAESEAAAKKWAELCKSNNGNELPYLGTQDVARDLESLRNAVGDEKLTYAGFSYGTLIGLVYADRYPDKVRAILLDGVVDPTLDVKETLIQQSQAVDDAYDRFISWCKANPGDGKDQCPIAPDPQKVIDDAVKLAKDDPLPGTINVDTIYLSTTFVNFAITTATYDSQLWPRIAHALSEYTKSNPDPLAELSNAYVGAASPSLNAAVNCLDAVTPKGDKYQKIVDEVAAAAPHLGVYNANTSRICEYWTTPPKPLPTQYSAKGSPPIMVFGTTGDNATPYANAVKVSEMLDNATLVTLEANRHAAVGENECVVKTQGDYLVNLKLPKEGFKC